MRPTELPRNVPSGLKSGAKLLRLKLNKQPAQQQQHTEPVSSQGTVVGSSSSSSTLQQPGSLLYSPQLWQATGYKFQLETVSRAYYFPDELQPQPVHKQLPPEGVEAGQQKRAKLSNGQYRQRACLAAAEPQQPVGAAYRQQHNRHITPGLAAAAAAASSATAAAAAAAAAEHQRASRIALVSPSSSSSRDGAGHAQQQRRQSVGSGAEPVQQLCVLPVPWPLTVGAKGRRSTRQRRTNMAQWQAILQPHAAGAVAMDVEQQGQSTQHMADLDHQHSGVLSNAQQQQQQEQLASKLWEQDTEQQQHLQAKQQQQQQQEAVALLQQLAPATPAYIKPSGSAFAAAAVAGTAAAAVAAKQHAAAEIAAGAAAAGDSSPHETSTSSEQTHDDMNESPRIMVRQQLSSWPSSSTDSVCQLQQQQLLQQLQQGKQGAAGKCPPAAAAGGWGSPSSPLPASAL